MALLRESRVAVLRRLRGDANLARLQERGLELGANVYIGRRTQLDSGFPWLIRIGSNTTISANVEILTHDASTKQSLGFARVAPVSIGDGVFIGLGAIILPGVTIGDGAIVAAGSVVRRDVDSGMVVAGNPAETLGTVESFVGRRRDEMTRSPKYLGPGWTLASGITQERIDRMRSEVRQAGAGYVP